MSDVEISRKKQTDRFSSDITVEIGGDTTKLSKALESVNKSIKGTGCC